MFLRTSDDSYPLFESARSKWLTGDHADDRGEGLSVVEWPINRLMVGSQSLIPHYYPGMDAQERAQVLEARLGKRWIRCLVTGVPWLAITSFLAGWPPLKATAGILAVVDMTLVVLVVAMSSSSLAPSNP